MFDDCSIKAGTSHCKREGDGLALNSGYEHLIMQRLRPMLNEDMQTMILGQLRLAFLAVRRVPAVDSTPAA